LSSLAWVEASIQLTGPGAKLLFDLGVASVGVGGFAGVSVSDGSEVVTLEAVHDLVGFAEPPNHRLGGVLGLASVEVLGDKSEGYFMAHPFFVLACFH